MTVEQLVAQHCLKVVTAHKWNKRAACRELDIAYHTLQRYLKMARAEAVPGDQAPFLDPLVVMREAHE